MDCGPTDSLMVEAVADIPLITGDETVDKTFPKIKWSFLITRVCQRVIPVPDAATPPTVHTAPTAAPPTVPTTEPINMISICTI